MAIPTVRALREASAETNDRYTYNGSYALNNLDMVFRDPSTGYIYPMSQISTANYANLTSKALLQRFAAKYFLGQSKAQKLATDVSTTAFPAATSLVSRMVCASATFAAGQLVAVDSNGGGTALLNDTVIATNDPDLAVGIVVSEYTSATTTVDCLLRSPLTMLAFGSSGLRIGKLTETIAYTQVGSITGAGPYTGTYTFSQKLPAGALVLGTRCFTNTIFAGTSPGTMTAATFTAGWTGHTSAFAAQSLDVLTAATGNSSLSTAAGPQVISETAPLLTFTLTGSNTPTAGNVTVSILYIAPEGP